jgi:hypothetical protein
LTPETAWACPIALISPGWLDEVNIIDPRPARHPISQDPAKQARALSLSRETE